jgi:hypothetical protein
MLGNFAWNCCISRKEKIPLASRDNIMPVSEEKLKTAKLADMSAWYEIGSPGYYGAATSYNINALNPGMPDYLC